MEVIAWVVYGFFLIGPYVIGFAVFSVIIFLLAKSALQRKRPLGIAVTVALFVGIGFVAFRYFLLSPQKFNSACASGIGIETFEKIKANSYALQYVENFGGGYLNHTDATVESAITNVALKKVEFVEIQDSNSTDPRYMVWGALSKFKPSSQEIGYFKVSRSTLSSGHCRWLMPDDVKPLDYGSYLPQSVGHEKNRALQDGDQTRECIAVEYISKPTSPYLIAFSIGKKMSEGVVQHEIRAIDLAKNSLIGKDVVYEYVASNVYASVAFWLANGKRHPRCPVNLFEGPIVQNLLGL